MLQTLVNESILKQKKQQGASNMAYYWVSPKEIKSRLDKAKE